MSKTSNYIIICVLILIIITVYLYYLKGKKDDETFINEYVTFCGINNSKNKCDKNSSCIWTTLSGQTMANGKIQSYSFCDVKNQS
jgi:hypothetical protein